MFIKKHKSGSSAQALQTCRTWNRQLCHRAWQHQNYSLELPAAKCHLGWRHLNVQLRAGRLLHTPGENAPQPDSLVGLDTISLSGTHLLKTTFSSSLLLFPALDHPQLWFGTRLRTPDSRAAHGLSVLRALSITAKCDMPNLHAPAHENTPSSCCTHLHNEAAVVLRLTEVGAHFKDAHRALLTQAHPGVVLFTLWQSVPECLEDLPDCFLAHWRHKKGLVLVQQECFCGTSGQAVIVPVL